MQQRPVRVRFAPSPTGPLHIGGVRTALYNFLFAKKHNGTFILRIEDTDQTRFVPGAEDYIYEALTWCNLIPDESPQKGGPHAPYRQSERKEIYIQFAHQLIQKGKAYYAFDTAEELDAIRKTFEQQGKTFLYNQETRTQLQNSLTLSDAHVAQKIAEGNYVIRLKVDGNEDIVFHDIIRGEVRVNSLLIDDKVLLKSDGMPTYHLANVVDDYLMQISHVIRGEEWLPSTPLHILLYHAFGWEEQMPAFAHLPLLLKPSGKGKLSKRDGDQLGFPVFPLQWKDPNSNDIASGYREKGFLPQAFINFLAFQGWNPGTEQEIFTLPELIQAFSLEKVHKAGAKFDYQKAIWYNEQYLRQLMPQEVLGYLRASVANLPYNLTDEQLLNAFELMKDRISFPHELFSKAYYLFEKPHTYDVASLQKKYNDKIKLILTKTMQKWQEMTEWHAEALETAFKNTLVEYNEKIGNAMPCLRIAITGDSSGPNLFIISQFIGKNNTIQRLHKFIETF